MECLDKTCLHQLSSPAEQTTPGRSPLLHLEVFDRTIAPPRRQVVDEHAVRERGRVEHAPPSSPWRPTSLSKTPWRSRHGDPAMEIPGGPHSGAGTGRTTGSTHTPFTGSPAGSPSTSTACSRIEDEVRGRRRDEEGGGEALLASVDASSCTAAQHDGKPCRGTLRSPLRPWAHLCDAVRSLHLRRAEQRDGLRLQRLLRGLAEPAHAA